MNETPIRAAVADDLPKILALYRELRPNDPEIAATRATQLWDQILKDPNLHVFVAERAGQIASSCMLAIVPNLASGGRPFGIVEHVITLARFRRRGIAHAVLRFALEFAWSRNCYKVILLSGMQRTDAHRMYEAVGFRGDIERGFVAKPSDVI